MIYLISCYVVRKCHRGDLGVISLKTLSIMGVLVTKDDVQIWNHAALLQASQHRTLWWFMCFYIRLVSLLFIKWLLGSQIATIRISVPIHSRRPLGGCQRVEWSRCQRHLVGDILTIKISSQSIVGGEMDEIVNVLPMEGFAAPGSSSCRQTKIGPNEDSFRQD